MIKSSQPLQISLWLRRPPLQKLQVPSTNMAISSTQLCSARCSVHAWLEMTSSTIITGHEFCLLFFVLYWYLYKFLNSVSFRQVYLPNFMLRGRLALADFSWQFKIRIQTGRQNGGEARRRRKSDNSSKRTLFLALVVCQQVLQELVEKRRILLHINKDSFSSWSSSWVIFECSWKTEKRSELQRTALKKTFCSSHWSSGGKKDIDDLPDMPCTSDYVKKNVTKKVTPNSKISSAKCVVHQQTKKVTKRRKLNYGSNIDTTDIFETKLTELREKLKEKTNQIEKLTEEVQLSNKQNVSYEQQLRFFSKDKENCTFSYANLKNKEKIFEYMTGLSLCDFYCLHEWIELYLTAMVYPDCKDHHSAQRKLSKKTELMRFLTICRHALHLGIMAFMTNTSTNTIL